ncbi:cytochrome c oxidase assembly protein [Mycobacterium intracellulare]|uniref:cytochrome c oxidase assembly protein n=1 Tax=Mycobacterium intracellulare TaxID=1767 RepID=UPI001CDA0689|nr:cytochrome c oxidase assembly protein [Mycobacterium intracellulare]MCA2306438.1 cytochrome c oxidase assembly protein [Mycobacterium intracellulare]MCA2348786.1 cytochrome c oxidase assembly protein [Mycobacterium intracellulare]
MGSSRTRARFTRSLAILAGVAVTAGAVAGHALASGGQRFLATGESYPGALTSVTEAVGYFAATLSGALVLGAIAYIVTVARPDDDGVIDPKSFRVHRFAERASLLWLVCAAVMIPVQAADNAGIPVFRLIGSGALGDAIAVSAAARGWIVAAIFSGVVATTLWFTIRWIPHCMLLIPSAIAVIAVPVTGNAGQGPDHDYTTSSVIVFALALSLLVGVKASAVLAPPSGQLRRRVLVIEMTSGALALLYGALLLWMRLPPATFTDSDYGRLAAGAAAALGIVWLADLVALLRSVSGRDHRSDGSTAASALAAMVPLAAVSAMAIQTAPTLLAHRFTAWDVFLGYALPRPPSALRLLTLWRFDTLIGVGAIALGAFYVAGVVRLRRRGDAWPVGRTAAWLTGCLALAFVTGSGVRAYGSAMFSVHMVEHMALNMFVPVFLVLGAPITLALRALPTAGADRPPGPREWLVWLVHSPVTRFMSHPVTAFVLFVGSLYAVYFTPLFDTMVRYHWGHELMSVHFLITGYVFFWGITGVDPGPRRLPFIGRLGVLFAVMPFHAFFGIAMMTTTSAVGGRFYPYVGLPWLSSILDDQHLGGAIAWGSSELPIVVVVISLVTQWAQQDRRAAARSDRHAEAAYDDDLDAYNAMLRELSRSRR